MYNLEDLSGEVITLKLISGIEVLAQLYGVDKDEGLFTVGEPKIVVINGADLALIPYIFTGPTEEVTMPLSAILSVCKASDESKADYEALNIEEVEINQDSA
jgi:hypothetical protein|tara:strand:- start:688 stop:993 length:306 start_codon:yes stop_codon:yes gene_type:complete